MSAVVHSINISTEGGVPKIPIGKAEVRFAGVDGDFNRFRTEEKEGGRREETFRHSVRDLVDSNHRDERYANPD